MLYHWVLPWLSVKSACISVLTASFGAERASNQPESCVCVVGGEVGAIVGVMSLGYDA